MTLVEAFREPRWRRAQRQSSTIARAIRAGRARAGAADPPAPVDGHRLRELLAEVAADVRLVQVPVDRAPWARTSLRVEAGESVTWFGWGGVALLKPLGITLPSRLALRVRVPGSTSLSSPFPTGTVPAGAGGMVEVGSAYPGEMDEHGGVTIDRIPYRVMRGALGAILVRWPVGTDVCESLSAIVERDISGLCALEIARLAEPHAPPPGWDDHPLLPPADVFVAGGGVLAADVRESVSIIRRPVNVPLTPALRLSWRWRVDELPSRLPEDTALTHDYLSVALEFDDGRDLTWHWSAGLPAGFVYSCPLEHWRHRETHIVVRNGAADLGRWVDEDRCVLTDHRVAIGGRAPSHVTRVWLIAVAVFQGHAGRAEFREIKLTDGESTIRVD